MAIKTKPFRFNTDLEGNEKKTYMDIMDDAISLFGEHCVYISQTLNQAEPIFGEYLGKLITEGTDMYLYPDEIEDDYDIDSSGMYSKFGFLPTIGNATFNATQQYFTSFGVTPKPQDLILYVKKNQMYEVNHVTEKFDKYIIHCELYNADHTKIDPTVTDDAILDLDDFNDGDVINFNDQIDAVADDEQEPVIPADDLGDGLY